MLSSVLSLWMWHGWLTFPYMNQHKPTPPGQRRTKDLMKKYLLTMALAVAACMSASAQSSIFNNPDNRAYFGIRVGGDVTCPGKFKVDNFSYKAFDNGGGVEFGGIYNIPVVANFYIEPGLKLYYDTYSADVTEFDDFDDPFDVSIKIKKFGMRIPVMAGYHFDFTDDIKVSVFTGPELEVGFSAKGSVKALDFETTESIYGDDGMNRVNLLWGVGAGISYSNFYFGVNGGIGMLNMMKESDVKFHENRVTFSLGYNF